MYSAPEFSQEFHFLQTPQSQSILGAENNPIFEIVQGPNSENGISRTFVVSPPPTNSTIWQNSAYVVPEYVNGIPNIVFMAPLNSRGNRETAPGGGISVQEMSQDQQFQTVPSPRGSQFYFPQRIGDQPASQEVAEQTWMALYDELNQASRGKEYCGSQDPLLETQTGGGRQVDEQQAAPPTPHTISESPLQRSNALSHMEPPSASSSPLLHRKQRLRTASARQPPPPRGDTACASAAALAPNSNSAFPPPPLYFPYNVQTQMQPSQQTHANASDGNHEGRNEEEEGEEGEEGDEGDYSSLEHYQRSLSQHYPHLHFDLNTARHQMEAMMPTTTMIPTYGNNPFENSVPSYISAAAQTPQPQQLYHEMGMGHLPSMNPPPIGDDVDARQQQQQAIDWYQQLLAQLKVTNAPTATSQPQPQQHQHLLQSSNFINYAPSHSGFQEMHSTDPPETFTHSLGNKVGFSPFVQTNGNGTGLQPQHFNKDLQNWQGGGAHPQYNGNYIPDNSSLTVPRFYVRPVVDQRSEGHVAHGTAPVERQPITSERAAAPVSLFMAVPGEQVAGAANQSDGQLAFHSDTSEFHPFAFPSYVPSFRLGPEAISEPITEHIFEHVNGHHLAGSQNSCLPLSGGGLPGGSFALAQLHALREQLYSEGGSHQIWTPQLAPEEEEAVLANATANGNGEVLCNQGNAEREVSVDYLGWIQGSWGQQEERGERIGVYGTGNSEQGFNGTGKVQSHRSSLGVKRPLKSTEFQCQSSDQLFQSEGEGEEKEETGQNQSADQDCPLSTSVLSPKRSKQGDHIMEGFHQDAELGGIQNGDLSNIQRQYSILQSSSEIFHGEQISNEPVESRELESKGNSDGIAGLSEFNQGRGNATCQNFPGESEIGAELVTFSSGGNLLPYPIGPSLLGSKKFAAARELLSELCTAEFEETSTLNSTQVGGEQRESGESALEMVLCPQKVNNHDNVNHSSVEDWEEDNSNQKNRNLGFRHARSGHSLATCSEGTTLSCGGGYDPVESSNTGECGRGGGGDGKRMNRENSLESDNPENVQIPLRNRERDRHRVPQLAQLTKDELLARRAALVGMLVEVRRQRRQYGLQLRAVEDGFERAAGPCTAAPYTAAPRRAMARCFRRLRDALRGDIAAVSGALAECARLGAVPGGGGGGAGRVAAVLRAGAGAGLLLNLAGGGAGQSQQRVQRGLPERAVALLRAWMFDHFLHPYPTDDDKISLARATGLKRSQVSNWFINARVRLWKPMIEQMYEEARQTNEEDERNEKLRRENEGQFAPVLCAGTEGGAEEEPMVEDKEEEEENERKGEGEFVMMTEHVVGGAQHSKEDLALCLV